MLLYENGDAVRIEPRPPSPSTCRLCARSLRTLFRSQARGDGTRMQGVLGESRASCRLSINSRAGSNSQAHSSSSTRGSSTTPDDGSHIHRIVRPRCRTESLGLRAGRVWACTRPLQSVHAAAELVGRGRVVVLVSWVCHRYCCCGTCYTRLLYNSIAYKSYQVPGNYVIDQA